MIRSILFAILFYATTTVLCIAYLPLMLLPRRVFSGAARLWVRIMLYIVEIVLAIRYDVRGAENRPAGAAIYASKHQSAWDVMIFTALVPDCAYILKRELFWIPLWGWYVWRVGMVGIDRGAGARALRGMVAQAGRILRDGRSIIIFPQGTRTPPGERRPYLPGAAALYGGTDCPVVPVALNSGCFWPRRRFRKWPGTITVEFLPQIPAGLARADFQRELESRIESATARLEAEANERRAVENRVEK